VHADDKAAAAAQALNADAFTVQSDVAFAEGRCQPGVEAGRRLIAHKLAHVVQQRSSGPLLQRQLAPGQASMTLPVPSPADIRAAEADRLREATEALAQHRSDVDELAAALDDSSLARLSLSDRLAFIREIAGDFLVGEKKEHTIIRLLAMTPTSDIVALQAELGRDGRLLGRLESVIDFGRYTEYHEVLRGLFFSAKTPEQAAREITTAKEFPWADPGLIRAYWNVRFYYEKVDITESGKLQVTFWQNLGPLGMRRAQDLELDPFETIRVRFYDSEETIGAAKGDVVAMPAINLRQLYNSQHKKEMMLIGDVAMMAGGVGELTAARRLRQVLGGLQAVFAAADVAIRDFRPNIERSEEGKAFLKAWDVVTALVAIYGVVRVAIAAPKVFINLRYLYRQLTKRLPEAEYLFEQAEQVSVLLRLVKAGLPEAQAERLAPVLEKAGVAVGELDEATVAAIRRADEAIAAKQIEKAINELDVVGERVGASKRASLETSLTEAKGITDLDFYRNPYAILPDGSKVAPTATNETLFHGTNDVLPAQALSTGLPVRGRDLSLLNHKLQGGDSAFRGSARMVQFPDGGGPADWGDYVYEIRNTPSWDINACLENRIPPPLPGFAYRQVPMVGELEQAIPAYVPPQNIVRWGRVVVKGGRKIVEWHGRTP
jgi:hypothetical protein